MSNHTTAGDVIPQTETRGIRVIEAGFNEAFSLKLPDEDKTRRFPCCQHSDDDLWVIEKDATGGFSLVNTGNRDNNFHEISRKSIPETSEVAYEYHDDEHGSWRRLSEWAYAALGLAAEA